MLPPPLHSAAPPASPRPTANDNPPLCPPDWQLLRAAVQLLAAHGLKAPRLAWERAGAPDIAPMEAERRAAVARLLTGSPPFTGGRIGAAQPLNATANQLQR